MNFENLPNELLLDIFDYLHAIHLLRAFYNLNGRLNTLSTTSVKGYHLDFRAVSKYDFETIYLQHHRSIIDQVISIHLADDDETPNLPQLFFSHHFPVLHFKHLQSLSLYSILSFDTLNNIVLQCHHLPSLIDLKFLGCRLNNALYSIINPIWTLSKLTGCTIDEDMLEGGCFTQLCETSLSIKSLSIDDVNCDFQCLTNILQRTPRLERFSTKIISIVSVEELTITLPLLTQLTLSFRGSLITLRNLFAQMPNLRSLTYNRSFLGLKGDEWEEIFLRYLTKVRSFRLRMNFQFAPTDHIEDKVDELLATFQTDFWMKKHRWFVRCDWNSHDPFHHASLYTLPYAFRDFHLTNGLDSKSTCPNEDDDCWSYEQVRDLICEKNISNSCPIKFLHLDHLQIILPFNENFFLNIPALDHLTTLDVTLLPDESVYDQLQTVLNRALHLDLLRFSHLSELEMVLFQLKNSSIRRLDFFTKESMIYSWYFNREQCIALADSSLGQQCQTLGIDVEHRTSILELFNRMTKLQSLTFRCEDDKRKYRSSMSTTDELLQWFHEHLPSTCSIARHVDQTSIFRLWIR